MIDFSLVSDVPIYEIPLAEIRGGHHVARVRSREIIIVETSEGLRVYDGVCPHLGGPLMEGRISSRAIVCPWHRYVFDAVSGKCRSVPGHIWRSACAEHEDIGPMQIALRTLRHEIRDRVVRVYES